MSESYLPSFQGTSSSRCNLSKCISTPGNVSKLVQGLGLSTSFRRVVLPLAGRYRFKFSLQDVGHIAGTLSLHLCIFLAGFLSFCLPTLLHFHSSTWLDHYVGRSLYKYTSYTLPKLILVKAVRHLMFMLCFLWFHRRAASA